MKQLVCVKDVETLKEEGKAEHCICEGAIITPFARDAADSFGVTSSHKRESGGGNAPSINWDMDSSRIYMVLKALMNKELLNRGLLGGVLDPYDSQRHPDGLKVMCGNSVRMDVFDTGNPEAKACFQELVGKEKPHISAGFLVIDHPDFQRELAYEETGYVIEGTLIVTIDEATHCVHVGGVLFVPSGPKVVWGLPDKAGILYTAYPADWTDLV